MKKVLSCIVLLIHFSSTAQKISETKNFEVSMSSGYSFLSLKDRNISEQEYTGTLTPIVVNWEYRRNRYTRRINLKYETGKINNFNVDARVDDISIIWNHSYNISEISLFNRPATLIGGFSPNIWLHYRKQDMAEPFQFLYSFKFMTNLGMHSGLSGMITDKLSYRSVLNFNLISYGVSWNVDEGNIQLSPVLSSFYSTPLLDWQTFFDYPLNDWLRIGIIYAFKYYQHQNLQLASDSLRVALTAKF